MDQSPENREANVLASLAFEFALLRTDFSCRQRNLRFTDAVFGISAGVVVVVGGLRVFYFDKGSE